MAVYKGVKLSDVAGQLVEKDNNPLTNFHSLKMMRHSPSGFSWGYGGSGPAQLALAILLEETTEQIALENYQQFKWDFVSNWGYSWEIDSEEIQKWLKNRPSIKGEMSVTQRTNEYP